MGCRALCCIKRENMDDKVLKAIIVDSCGFQHKQEILNEIFQWLKNAPNREDLEERIWCIKKTERYKDLYEWINRP